MPLDGHTRYELPEGMRSGKSERVWRSLPENHDIKLTINLKIRLLRPV
jgi:hypothetical protein